MLEVLLIDNVPSFTKPPKEPMLEDADIFACPTSICVPVEDNDELAEMLACPISI